ncbi:MAG: nucleoside-diphosphate kinase [Pseudomonadota bacterium]|jgi:nucleoside-diphosphate kinase
MSKQRTLSIIKPDATARNLIGKILSHFEEAGLTIVAAKMATLTPQEAGQFYIIHKDRPFYGELIDYMCSGRVLVSVLEGEDAVNLNRKLMGATDPKKADPGTIRALYAESIAANAVHGSDSVENAATEIKLFFPELA